jgi:hypothetical protein
MRFRSFALSSLQLPTRVHVTAPPADFKNSVFDGSSILMGSGELESQFSLLPPSC